MDSRTLKVELQSYGLRIPDTKDIRSGGAGPTGGIHLKILSGGEANIPVVGDFVSASPYHLDQINGEHWIFKDGVAVAQVELMEKSARFQEHKTSARHPDAAHRAPSLSLRRSRPLSFRRATSGKTRGGASSAASSSPSRTGAPSGSRTPRASSRP